MRIFVLPVSGGAFPLQLAYISQLLISGGPPELVLGSSGGNIAGYIGLAAKWNPDQIGQVVKEANLNTSNFAQSWWPWGLNKIFPSWLIGYYQGSFYASGTGAAEVIQKMFTDETVVVTEMWTGTLNKDEGKGQMFCNLSESQSRIAKAGDPSVSLWTRDCNPLCYLNGDRKIIADVAIASASIPVVVPAKVIEGKSYVDGGTIFSSPLSALADYIYNLSKTDSIHLNYINSYDIQNAGSTKITNLWTAGRYTIGELMKNICIADRQIGIDLVRSGPEPVYYSFLEGTLENLKLVEELRPYSPRSLLEIFPSVGEERCLDLLNFTAEDIIKMFERAQSGYYLRFWWAIDLGKDGNEGKKGREIHQKFTSAQKLSPMRYNVWTL